MIQMLTHKKKNWKTKQLQRPGDRGQQGVESEEKNCSNSNWGIRTIKKGLGQNLQLPPGPRATDHTNEHCTSHL